jgi:hypothetical protein
LADAGAGDAGAGDVLGCIVMAMDVKSSFSVREMETFKPKDLVVKFYPNSSAL